MYAMFMSKDFKDNIPGRFTEVARSFADGVAVSSGGDVLSYGDLDARSDALARGLLSAGVEPGARVAVAARRGPETIVAFLAILKAGAGYVPLPESYPSERLELIRAEAEIDFVVGDFPALEALGVRKIDPDTPVRADNAEAPPLPTPGAESVAYVMYTSGSTGRPKGVMVPHRGIVRLVQDQDFMDLGPDERILQNAPLAFDAATLEIWGALLNGGTLVLPEGEETGTLRGLGAVIARERITTMWLTAGLFHVMADERPGDFAPLRQLLTGGDVVSPVKVSRVMAACPDLVVINGYGPTENTTFTCCHTITAEDLASGRALPIGRAISGTQVYVTDATGQPVPDGETGELCAAGLGLALGYLGRPDLTEAAFVPAAWDAGTRLYRTGDLVRRDADGIVQYLGRLDTQVKIRGFRVELGEIETGLEAHPGVGQAAVVAVAGADGADKTLVGYYTGTAEAADLLAHLAERVPDYAMPQRLARVDALPVNQNGKVDRKDLEARGVPKMAPDQSRAEEATPDAAGADTATIEALIAEAMADVLGHDDVARDVNFFDLGASSLHVARVHERVQTALDRTFPISDFFLKSTVLRLAAHLAGETKPGMMATTRENRPKEAGQGLIAIVGMAGRFPGAPSVNDFWEALTEGRELISHFSEDELDIDPAQDDPTAPYVRARGVMPDADMFDASHFGIPPREAERMDPQHRILLEVAQTALDDAGVDPERFPGRIGIFAGSSQNSYLLNNLLSPPGASRALAAGYPVKDFATLFGNDKDFIATRVAYKLNLRGPAMTVLTACSTSLVAVGQGIEALRKGDADMVLAGGVSVTFPSKRPYLYTPDGMASSDGHCRTFDAEATGTVFGDGAGLVALRRLEDALEDGQEVIAVIRGFAINNDGSDKAGYAAPSIQAQADVIRAAHEAAGVEASEIGYIEAHGTGTPLGDPIEFAALSDAFGASEGKTALGSAKTYVGHLDIAAGVTGLIKTALSLKNGTIPPLLHYTAPNPRIDFEASPFFPVTETMDWSRGEIPRRAGVSAFGVGGTNIHMVLEEAPVAEPMALPPAEGLRIFPVSASSPDALKQAVADLGQWAEAHGDADADAVAETLRFGRKAFAQRAVVVAEDMAGLAEAARVAIKPVTAGRRSKIAFLFPGQGAQHVGMARELYETAPVFREALSLCAQILEPELGLNLLDVIHAPAAQDAEMTERLKNTALAQPAIFSIGYALAKEWDHRGIAPDAMVGHSIGEFAAATVAGVIDLPDALGLIALRGRLMADLPKGVMVSVRASEEELAPWLGKGLDLAAVNGAQACVLAGPEDVADKVLAEMEAEGIVTSRLHTSHAFHSHMMEPALAPFRAAVAKINLRAPQIPILSTVTGGWLTEDEATDPDYWAGHMRRPVRFYDAMQMLWAEGQHIFLETGPGRTMTMLGAQNPDRKAGQPAIASLPHAQAEDRDSARSMAEAFGMLWAHGYGVEWTRIDPHAGDRVQATGLPTYPFQRKRFWVEPVEVETGSVQALRADTGAVAEAEIADAPPVSAIDALRDLLNELSGVEPEDMPADAGFLELGFDSLMLTQVTRELTDRFGVSVSLRQLIDGFDTLQALADHITAEGNLAGTPPADRTPMAEMTRIETEDAPDAKAEATPSSAPVTKIARETDEITPEQRAHIDALSTRFNAKTPQSKALTEKHRPTHADPRTASGFNRMWKDLVYQIVTVQSKGSRLLDVDGNEYIDILNGFGPGFLGHSPDHVVKAVQEQMNAGFEVGPQSLAAMEAADLFCEVTGNDRASFVCTGSEAVYAAMRLARTVTSRDKIVVFARDYHGNFDEVLVRGIDGKDGPRTLPLAPGVPRDAVKNVVVLPYGTPQALDYIRKNADSLAAVMVEPVQSRRPEFRPAEFIREVRRITEKSGSLFIFDEVVTGFRFGPRGAQAYYGVEADLVTYGKVVGGGMPVGVVSGKARYMDTFDGGQWGYGDDSFPSAPVTFFAGTFVRHPLAMASLRAMLQFFRDQPPLFWKTVNAKGDRLAGRVDRWFEDNDMPFRMPNCGSLMYLRIAEDQKFGPLLGAHMRDRGVFLLEGFPSYMTAAHDDADIDHVVEAFKDSALEMRAAGMLSGRDAVPYAGPQVSAVAPRLSLPDGPAAISKAMNAPLGPLEVETTEAQREIAAAMVLTPEVSAAYNESVTLKLEGAVDRDALRDASRAAFARHDALRATFAPDGMTMKIHPEMEIAVPLVDLTAQDTQAQDDALRTLIADEVDTPFNLETGPLVRAYLVALSETRHHLVITAHHIVCDGWSIDVIMRDIGAIYSASRAGEAAGLPAPLSIVDYVRAELDWARTSDADEARAYWLSRFEGPAPVLDLPTDHPRPARRSTRGGRLDRALPDDLVARLRALARSSGTTFVTLMLAAYKLHVARLAGTSDIVIGLPAAGQSARGMDSVVGHCVNLLPIRTAIDWQGSFADYLGQVRTAMLDAFEHQTFTYGELVRELRLPRDAGRLTLVPVVFNIDNGIDLSTMSFGPTETEFVTNPRSHEHFELYLNLTDSPDEVRTEWSFAADLFEDATVSRQIDRFIALLERICDDDGRPLAAVSAAQVIEPAPAPAPEAATSAMGAMGIPGRFTEVARSFADGVAVSSGGDVLSYGDLDARSDALARGLLSAGVEPGARVAVAARRGPETIVAFLAILKAGAGYVPLPESYPSERLELIRAEAEIDFVVGDFPALEALGVRKIDPDTPVRADNAEAPPLPTPGAESVAYVMYTSGSTGRPKGVMVPHRGIVRLVQDQDFMDLGPDERILQNAPLAFDAATLEIWGALLNGGTLVLPEGEETGTLRGLGAVIARERITTMWLTAGLFHVMADERPGDFAPLRQLLTGGDVVSPVKVSRVMAACPDLVVINGYGPTENTTFTCCHTITAEDLASGRALPIGRAISGTQVYVTDATGQPVPDGETGELCAAGLGLALGYLGRPDLTEAAFVPAAWDAGTRLYRTGDLVRRDADGIVQYLGRLDTQVKIRGFRVELGEIETGLEAHPGVGQAAVVAVAGADGADKTLVGYYTGTAEAADLLAHLAERVPDYAMPQRLARVDALPVNQNGKVDRKDLEARGVPAITREAQDQGASPDGPIEERLATIWTSVLGIDQVDATTSFFELGGHSLLAVRLFDRIRTEFGADLPISTLFRHQSIRDLARLLSMPSGPEFSEATPIAGVDATATGLVDRSVDWDTSVVIHPGPETDAELPFFVVGGIGGNVNNLYDLAQRLGQTRPVVGFQTRGVLGHTPRDTIEEMATENIRYMRQHQPQGPYVISGYSGGALTAFEMVRQLEEAGETVRQMLVLDTYAPGFAKDFIPNIRVTKGERLLDEWQQIQSEGVGRFLSRLRQWAQFKLYQGPFKGLLRSYDMSLYRHRVMEETWSSAARRYEPGAVLKAPIALFYTPPRRLLDRIALSGDQTLGWGSVTGAGPVEATMVTGDHNSMLVGPNAESLARHLETIIGTSGAAR
jgi:amino acid adenylation domain-containing protein